MLPHCRAWQWGGTNTIEADATYRHAPASLPPCTAVSFHPHSVLAVHLASFSERRWHCVCSADVVVVVVLGARRSQNPHRPLNEVDGLHSSHGWHTSPLLAPPVVSHTPARHSVAQNCGCGAPS